MDESPQATRWYGWQTLALDGAGIALIAAGLERGAGDLWHREPGAETMATAGAITFLAGAPTVHMIHRRPLAALGSAGMRIAAPLAGLYAGHAVSGCGGNAFFNDCDSEAAGVGLLLGAAAAITLDAALLAREAPPREQRRRAPVSRPSVAPGVAITGQSRALVLAGSF